jgi:hypothetical protein
MCTHVYMYITSALLFFSSFYTSSILLCRLAASPLRTPHLSSAYVCTAQYIYCRYNRCRKSTAAEGRCTGARYLSFGTTLSEKLEYLFFSPRTCQCYFMNIHNKYFGKIFSALSVDVFPELFRIFPNFDIS